MAAGLSYLDTQDISRQVARNSRSVGNGLLEHPARRIWVGELEQATADHRERRALGLERRARRREHWGALDPAREQRAPDGQSVQRCEQFHRGHVDGMVERSAHASGAWHRARANGQRRRFDNVRECQVRDEVRVCCESCGSVSEQGARCLVGLVCPSCRGMIARRKRARFASARLWSSIRRRGEASPIRVVPVAGTPRSS